MKRTFLSIMMICSLLGLVSCWKELPPPVIHYQGGSWTFNGIVYQDTSCLADVPSAEVSASGISPADINNIFFMTFSFMDGYPADSGTYNVVNANSEGTLLPLANQVMVDARLYGPANGSWYSAGGTGAQTIRVTFANGKINMSGTNIAMTNGAGTSNLSFHITQTQ